MKKSSSDKWDVGDFRIDPSLVGVAKPAKPKPHRRGRVHGPFICGPVPLVWVVEAAKHGVSALLLGNILWHLSGRNYNKLTFSVSNVAMTGFGLTRQAKYRALQALEGAGLEVHRSGKRSIGVTLLCAAGETPEAIISLKQYRQ